MNHPSELAIHKFLNEIVNGDGHISDAVADQIADDVRKAVKRQFGREKEKWKLRMSSVGRPACQQWFDKNKPDEAEPFPSNFIMNMLIGDCVEAIFKGLMREADVPFNDSERVTLTVNNDVHIKGEYDMELDGKIDDIKSASQWSYNNKFVDGATLQAGDDFGYVPQLVGYADAAGKEVGGWWVVNKANGEFKYVSSEGADLDEARQRISHNVSLLKRNEFVRQFEAEEETWYGKPTGNKKIGKSCEFCRYKHSCWPTLEFREAIFSTAKNKPVVGYVEINNDGTEKEE